MMSDDFRRTLELPQVHAVLNGDAQERGGTFLVLVLGGRPPAGEWLRHIAKGCEVWAVDRGADVCRGADVIPRRFMGDPDTVSEAGRAWMERERIPAELCAADEKRSAFQVALERARGDVIVTGCWGGNFDHAVANAFCTDEGGARVVCLGDEHELFFPLLGKENLRLSNMSMPLTISLLPMLDAAVGVSVEGSPWSMENTDVPLSRPWVINDMPFGEDLIVSLAEGALGVYTIF